MLSFVSMKYQSPGWYVWCRMSFCNDNLLIDFFTLLKMVMPTGIIASSIRASDRTSSLVCLSAHHKTMPWVKLNHTESVRAYFPSLTTQRGTLGRKEHWSIYLGRSLELLQEMPIFINSYFKLWYAYLSFPAGIVCKSYFECQEQSQSTECKIFRKEGLWSYKLVHNKMLMIASNYVTFMQLYHEGPH